MTDLRTAAQAVIDAYDKNLWPGFTLNDAMDALRAVLAQPIPQSSTEVQGEPEVVAWVIRNLFSGEVLSLACQNARPSSDIRWVPLYTRPAPIPAPAEGSE